MQVVEKTGAEKFRILIVEDDCHIARLMMENLCKAGFECRYAPDGGSALTAFEQAKPHLVLLDLMMVGLSGYDVCLKIRAFSKVPIVVVTAKSETEDHLRSLKLGADDFITKPFDPKLLIARVVTHLRRAYRYDVPAEPVKTAPLRRESKLPSGWAGCSACNYMGPGTVFENRDSYNRVKLVCPHCHESAYISFAVS